MDEPSLFFLPERSLISVHGPEAEDFLHDLVTADIRNLPEKVVRPSALLTPQGRILYDMLISRDEDGFLLECDHSGRDDLLRRLKLFRLRRKLDLETVGLAVHASTSGPGLQDERFAETVYRRYGESKDKTGGDNEGWKKFRWRRGVPEGGKELPSGQALPLEARFDLSHGISFEKGCYIGQEVTARTRYRGLVKRSYVPVRADEMIAAPSDIEADGKQAGLLLDSAPEENGSIGLASIRLEYLKSDSTVLSADGIPLLPFVPDRLFPLPGD